MIASRVVVVSEVVAELAFRMKLPGIHDVDVSALYPLFHLVPFNKYVIYAFSDGCSFLCGADALGLTPVRRRKK